MLIAKILNLMENNKISLKEYKNRKLIRTIRQGQLTMIEEITPTEWFIKNRVKTNLFLRWIAPFNDFTHKRLVLTAKEELREGKFFDPKKYDLGRVGRYKINQKLGIEVDLGQRVMTNEDFIAATKYLINLLRVLNITEVEEAIAILAKFFPKSAAHADKERFVVKYLLAQETSSNAPRYPGKGG